MIASSTDTPSTCCAKAARREGRLLRRLNSFVFALESGQTVEPSLTDGLHAQLIAEAAVESLRRNRPVTISY